MKKQLFFYIIVTIFLGLLGFFAVSVFSVYANNANIAKDMVIETTHLYTRLYNDETILESFVQTGSDTRITVIASDGKVLADTRPLDMTALGNHLHRPEIQAAANENSETFIRYSETLGMNLLFYALKKNVGDTYVFIRAAIPIAKINTYIDTSLPILTILLFAIALICFFFTQKMIDRITKPLSSIENKLRALSHGVYWHDSFVPETAAENYDEINKITQNINEVAVLLQNSFTALSNEKNIQDYILNNISDGLFLVDENNSIVLINSSALEIFNAKTNITGKNLNYLSYNKTLADAVNESVIYAKSSFFEISLDGRIFFTTVKKLPETSLTMIALTDVTENRENAKRREEFFANASHELKTPLTAIRGFSELTAINNKDEDIRKYVESITRETDRMLSLVGDMLKLSELENMRELNPIPINLAKTVNEIHSDLSTAIAEKAIIFETQGDAIIKAEPGHVYELVKNLVENAVRYNNQNGKILVKIENDNGMMKLTVSDNGIGISSEDQTRIFERFYRVEKSRSQKNGGTGLGLSIVKHICVLYGWELSLQSKLGIGTEVRVVFGESVQDNS
jgi:two-component system phosphate regulon sensor histidine kinase PhoR